MSEINASKPEPSMDFGTINVEFSTAQSLVNAKTREQVAESIDHMGRVKENAIILTDANNNGFFDTDDYAQIGQADGKTKLAVYKKSGHDILGMVGFFNEIKNGDQEIAYFSKPIPAEQVGEDNMVEAGIYIYAKHDSRQFNLEIGRTSEFWRSMKFFQVGKVKEVYSDGKLADSLYSDSEDRRIWDQGSDVILVNDVEKRIQEIKCPEITSNKKTEMQEQADQQRKCMAEKIELMGEAQMAYGEYLETLSQPIGDFQNSTELLEVFNRLENAEKVEDIPNPAELLSLAKAAQSHRQSEAFKNYLSKVLKIDAKKTDDSEK
ncbi:MAG: hypothetical protein H7A33_04495 [Deltaproteobacteria bacterium]|nr:hypothetical protein [Deltaproteobacteria bacterium]